MKFSFLSKLKTFFASSRFTRILDCIFISLFAIVLLIPCTRISRSKTSAIEKRKLATRPHLFIDHKLNEKYFSQFESYFNDRFNGRKLLLKLHKWITTKTNVWGNASILQGSDGWLFWKLDRSIDNFQNNIEFSPEELAAIAQYLTDIHNWAEAHGKKFYYVICPDKEKIYGEHITALQKIRPDSEGRIVKLVRYLRENTPVHVIYPRDLLLASKDTGLLFFGSKNHTGASGELG